jgi:transcriptional regulator with XRE-family HTH domain
VTRPVKGITLSPYAHPLLRIVRERMITTGTSAATLAKKAGLDESTIYHWAAGRQHPSLLHFCWVAEVLGMELRLCYTV